jgi:hypothetical protein
MLKASSIGSVSVKEERCYLFDNGGGFLVTITRCDVHGTTSHHEKGGNRMIIPLNWWPENWWPGGVY